MKKRLATLFASVLFVSAFTAMTPGLSRAAVLTFDGKVGKVAIEYMVYNNGSQRFVTEKQTFQDSTKSVSPNSVFTLDEAPPFSTMDGEMLVDTKVSIVFHGELLDVSKGMVGNITCTGRILLNGDVDFNGSDYTGTGEVLEFDGADVVNMVGKENKDGQIVGVARMVIIAKDAEVVDIAGGTITGRTPTKADLKLTPMRFEQTIL